MSENPFYLKDLDDALEDCFDSLDVKANNDLSKQALNGI